MRCKWAFFVVGSKAKSQ